MWWFWPPKLTVYPSPTSCPRLLGSPWPAHLPASASGPPASPSVSQPSAIQCPSSSAKSSSRLPKSPSSPQGPLKTNGFHEFLLCQPGCLQHPFWMPKASKVTPSDLQRQPRSSQAHPKCSLEAPKVIPNAPMCTHGAQFEPTVNPGTPKINPKTSKMLPK